MTINININPDGPVFNGTYFFRVNESVPVTTFVGQVFATDSDGVSCLSVLFIDIIFLDEMTEKINL